MARILVVGIATLDVVNTVDGYPGEDEEVRALAQRLARGGNGANTAVVLRSLGHQCAFAGVLTDDWGGRWVRRSLKESGVDIRTCRMHSPGQIPTSYIALNRRNGSRTIVHFRDLPEFSFDDFLASDPCRYDWCHFEGRNIGETLKMLHYLRQACADIPVSIEIEKRRPDNEERLMDQGDVLFFSRGYALGRGFTDGTAFLRAMREKVSPRLLICPWSAEGAFALSAENELFTAPAFLPSPVVDTIGAGDVFNAGMIHGLLNQLGLDLSLEAACRLAGRKCGQEGFDGLLEGCG